jgi:hypothetical protein
MTWIEAYLWICAMVVTMWGFVEISVVYINRK